MKVWGIIATVLLLAAAGFGIWQYKQNQDLKSQKSQVESDLASAKSASDQLKTKMASAGSKVELINKVFAGINSQEESLAIYDMVKALNNDTLTADWKAMQNSKPGDNTGNKFLTDLLASVAVDLK